MSRKGKGENQDRSWSRLNPQGHYRKNPNAFHRLSYYGSKIQVSKGNIEYSPDKKKIKMGHSKCTLMELLEHKDGNDDIRDCSHNKTKYCSTMKRAN